MIKKLHKDLSPNDFTLLVWLDQDLKLEIIADMNEFGGSFVKALANCMIYADRQNLMKIVKEFPYPLEYAPDEWDTKLLDSYKFIEDVE